MSATATRIIEGTISAIILFWIIKNADGFNKVVGATSQAIVGSARELWGGNVAPNG